MPKRCRNHLCPNWLKWKIFERTIIFSFWPTLILADEFFGNRKLRWFFIDFISKFRQFHYWSSKDRFIRDKMWNWFKLYYGNCEIVCNFKRRYSINVLYLRIFKIRVQPTVDFKCTHANIRVVDSSVWPLIFNGRVCPRHPKFLILSALRNQ